VVKFHKLFSVITRAKQSYLLKKHFTRYSKPFRTKYPL